MKRRPGPHEAAPGPNGSAGNPQPLEQVQAQLAEIDRLLAQFVQLLFQRLDRLPFDEDALVLRFQQCFFDNAQDAEIRNFVAGLLGKTEAAAAAA